MPSPMTPTAAAHTFRCGDTARIEGADYDIEVAYADPVSGRSSWCGWPEGDVATAKLTLVAACTEEEHKAAVARWLDNPRGSESDHRRGVIERLYRPRAYWKSVCAQIQKSIDDQTAHLATCAAELVKAEDGPEDV